MVLDVVNKFRAEIVVKESINLQVLQWPTPQGKVPQGDDNSWGRLLWTRFFRIFLLCRAAKDMKCASFPNLALSTLLTLMNVLVTFNAHLSLSDTLPIDSPRFCFLPHFVLCLIAWYYIMQYELHFFVYTFNCFDEIHLIGFYFVT